MKYPLEICTLMDLGLTLSQAKIYLALCRIGPSEASTISKVAKVDRSDVYRNIHRLEQISLIEKGINYPTEFKAIPMETALDILFDKKAEKYKELESKTKFMRQEFTKKISEKMPVQSGTEFALIPSGRAIIKRFKKNTGNAQKSINLITTSERFLHSCSPYVNSTKKALLRHVDFRLIIEEPDGTPLRTKEHLISMWKGTSMKIRHISAIPFVIMIMYDKKEVYVSAKSTLSVEGSPYLWSNNTTLLAMANSYFETLWRTAKKI